MTVEHPFNKIVEGIAVSDIRQFDRSFYNSWHLSN